MAARAEMLRRVAHSIAEDPALAAKLRRREQAALIGIASVLSDTLDRDAIRATARRSSRLTEYYSQLFAAPAFWEPFEFEGLEHLRAAAADARGVIVVPAHFGRYRWVEGALVDLGCRVALLVDRANAEGYRAFREFTAALAPDRTAEAATAAGFPYWLTGEGIDIVTAEDAAALWQLRLHLRKGSVAVMYADGNTGMDHRPIDDACQLVPFLGRRIAVRAGIGALASVSGAPVVPVFAEDRGRRPPLLRFEAPLRRGEGEGSRALRERVMATLFSLIEREVRRRPHRWEEWDKLPAWGITRYDVDAPAHLPSSVAADPDALLRTRLSLANPWVWLVEIDGARMACDLRRGASIPASPAHAAIVEAAERNDTTLAVMERAPDVPAAFAALLQLAALGFVQVAPEDDPPG